MSETCPQSSIPYIFSFRAKLYLYYNDKSVQQKKKRKAIFQRKPFFFVCYSNNVISLFHFLVNIFKHLISIFMMNTFSFDIVINTDRKEKQQEKKEKRTASKRVPYLLRMKM